MLARMIMCCAQASSRLLVERVAKGGEAPTRMGRRLAERWSTIDHTAVGSRGDHSAEAGCLRVHRGATVEALSHGLSHAKKERVAV